MKRGIYTLLLIWFVCAPKLTAQSVEIAVRVIDARSGKPFSGIDVWYGSWNGGPDLANQQHVATEVKKTDPQGRVVFRIAEPIPEHVSFGPSPMDFEYCSTHTFSPERVFRTGEVADYKPNCGRLKWQGTAQPGEVVVFVVKLGVWQKILREIP